MTDKEKMRELEQLETAIIDWLQWYKFADDSHNFPSIALELFSKRKKEIERLKKEIREAREIITWNAHRACDQLYYDMKMNWLSRNKEG